MYTRRLLVRFLYNARRPMDHQITNEALPKSSHTRCAATWPFELELKLFLSNNVRMFTAIEMSYCAIIIVTIAHIVATFSRLCMT